MTQSDVMIVDDNPANLSLLEGILRHQGCEVHSFPLGRLALAAAARNPPDLILLDINMPEMNGYEVCERLKAVEALRDIPIIFLSALSETQDKVKAFRAGAVDYISKPFQLEEIQARVETQLRLQELRQALKRHNERLEEAVAERTHQLAEANERLSILDSSKNDFLKLISHELRTPLNGLFGVGELIFDEMPSTEQNLELREMFEESRCRILSIVDDSLLLSQIAVQGEVFRSTPVRLSVVLRRAVDSTLEFADSRRVGLPLTEASSELIEGDEDLLVRALASLLETAVKFSIPGETVELALSTTGHRHTVTLESRGRKIPVEALPRFFEVFSIGEASTPAGDLGLGPSVAYRILQLFGASISVTNLDPSGIRLTITFPAASSTQSGDGGGPLAE